MKEIQAALFALQDEQFRAFNARLLPTVSGEQIIGVRTPKLRALAKSLAGSELAERFLRELPHAYFEENGLHAFLLERIADFNRCLAEVERFLPYIDNWATCDCMAPRALARRPQELEAKAQEWIASSRTYTVRYGIGTLLRYFLDERFCVAHLELVAGVRSDEYYVNMMIAWYFATALAKQWQAALPILQECRLARWAHNKTIQKAIESDRIAKEQKEILRALKIR